MRIRKTGRIINFGSIALKIKMEGSALYTASKGALLEFTKVFAKELAPFNITCNMLFPGVVDTAMARSLPKSVIDKCLEHVPTKRFSSLEDVGHAVDSLLSEKGGLITGQEITVGAIS